MHCYIVSILLLAAPGGLLGVQPDEALGDRVARLVKQLGHDKYAQREAASKELDAIGEPALDALRRAMSHDDAEIRLRAANLVDAITGRIRAAVTKKELEKLQGAWSLVSMESNGKQIMGEDNSFIFTFKEDKWSLHVNGRLSQAGTVRQIEVKGKHNTIDLPITEGGGGATAMSIYAVDGDSLKYLYCAGPRATEFATKPGDGRIYSILRRVKANAARPPEVRFESAAFSPAAAAVRL
jgi:uncharacterized protein (TIGR03067 family)